MPKNYPTQVIEQLPAEQVSDRMKRLMLIRKLHEDGGTITGGSTDEAFRERVTDYFRICEESGFRPGVEMLALALGTTRTSLFRWKNGIGCTERRQKDVQAALQLVYAFLEASGLDGSVSPVTAIWLSKNWMGYSDSVVISAARGDEDKSAPVHTAAEIAEKYGGIVEPPEKPSLDE